MFSLRTWPPSVVRTVVLAVCLIGSTLPAWAQPSSTPLADSVNRLRNAHTPKTDLVETQPQQRRRSGAQGALKGAVIGGLIGFAAGVLVAEVAARDSGEPNFALVLPPVIGFGVAGGYLGSK